MKIHSFLPTRKTLKNWHDRKKYIEEPLFPSYIFVYLKDMEAFYSVIAANGFLYYVRTGKEIARVSEAVVNDIKMVIDHAADVEVSTDRFQPGLHLVIKDGVLAGLNCEVVRFNSKRMILVRVDLLQRNILLTLPAGHLIVA
jgi:transcription antitermination factor NusG